MAEPSMPRSLSTMETRTLRVPKSTPATIDMNFSVPKWPGVSRTEFFTTEDTEITEEGCRLSPFGDLGQCQLLGGMPGALVPVHLPAEIFGGCFVHGGVHGREIRRHVMLKSLLANVAQQFLHIRDLDHPGAAEGVQRIVGEAAM